MALAYERNAHRPVAYIDETYRSPSEPGRKFYVMVAVVVAADVRDLLRSGIEQIAGSDYWHTTESIKTAEGLSDAKYMLSYLNEGPEVCVLSAARTIDANDRELERARQDAFTLLLPELEKGSDRRDPVRLAMMERRRARVQRGADERTHKDLVTSGHIHRNFRIMQVSPRHEKLLWLPDVVCSAVRRDLVQQKTDMLDEIRESLEYLA